MTEAAFNQDSMALIRAIGNASARSGGTYQNPVMGYGTARDPLSHGMVVQTPELTDQELSILYESDHLVQRIGYLYPQEAAQHWMHFTAGSQSGRGKSKFSDDDLQGYLNSKVDKDPDLDDSLNTELLSKLFYEASLNARIFGRSYLLLGVEDGRKWDEPINVETIKSLRWIEPLYHFEVEPVKSGRGYSRSSHFKYLDSRRYGQESVSEEFTGDTLIHRSRIIPFYGVSLPEFSLQRRGGRQLSVIQGVYRSLSRASQSMDGAIYLLATASTFTYGLKGLSQIKDETVRKLIEVRFEAIMMAMSSLRGMPHDSDSESIGFANRSFGGIKELLELTLDQIAQNCDVPRFKLFEVSEQKGLSGGDKSKSERYLWSQLLDSWRSQHWKEPFLYLGKIAAFAQDSPTKGRQFKDLGVSLPSSLQLTPQEIVEMRNTHMDVMSKANSMSVLNPFEIRMSTYGGSEWSMDVTLDDRITEQMEKTAIQTEQPAAEGEPDPASPEEGGTDPVNPTEAGAAPSEGELEQFDAIDVPHTRSDDATRAQKKLTWQGFTIGMQYFPFDERHGKLLRCGYGYIEKTRGADGMACDVYIGMDLDSDRVFVVDQLVNGEFDENKYIIGVRSIEEARNLYLSAMPLQFLGAIRETTIAELETQRIDSDDLSDREWDQLSQVDDAAIKSALRAVSNADQS